MSETPRQYTPGQRVLVVRPGRSGYDASARREFADVASVGRRWVKLSTGERFDPTSGRVDGSNTGYGSGIVYADAERFEREQRNAAAWREFAARVRDAWRVPVGVDAARIEQAARALGWTLTTTAPAPAPGAPGGEGNDHA